MRIQFLRQPEEGRTGFVSGEERQQVGQGRKLRAIVDGEVENLWLSGGPV